MPYRIYGQHINYLWKAPSLGSWDRHLAGKTNAAQSKFWETKPVEELYDTENDPWEVNNLATDPNYKEVLERMRRRMPIGSKGFMIPDSFLKANATFWQKDNPFIITCARAMCRLMKL